MSGASYTLSLGLHGSAALASDISVPRVVLTISNGMRTISVGKLLTFDQDGIAFVKGPRLKKRECSYTGHADDGNGQASIWQLAGMIGLFSPTRFTRTNNSPLGPETLYFPWPSDLSYVGRPTSRDNQYPVHFFKNGTTMKPAHIPPPPPRLEDLDDLFSRLNAAVACYPELEFGMTQDGLFGAAPRQIIRSFGAFKTTESKI